MITGDEKWIVYNNQSAEKEVEVGEVKHRKGKQRWRSTKRSNAVNMVGLEGISLL